MATPHRTSAGYRLPRAAVGIVLLLTLAAPGAAQIERHTDFEPPDLLELIGHVGPPLPAETGGWELTLGDGFTPTVYKFHLSKMRVINSGRLPGNILFAVEPYHPNFRLFGSPDELAALAAATPEQPAVITGYRRIGSTNLLLTNLTVTSTPIVTPQPGQTP